MKKQTALDRGYRFTGVYSSWKQDVLDRRQHDDFKGVKSVIVTTQCGGYAVYAEDKYFIRESLNDTQKRLDKVQDRREALKAKYEAELAELDKQEAEWNNDIVELKDRLSNK